MSDTIIGDPSANTPGLDDDFDSAAREYDVPVDLLKAISYVETSWNQVAGDDELGRPAAHGMLGLWGDNLALGAKAAGISEDEARTTVRANLLAGAARLAELAAARGIAGDDLMAWSPVLEDYSQNPDADARAAYVQDVLGVLANGASSIAESGDTIASISPHLDMVMSDMPITIEASADYSGSIWRPSPNYSSRGGYGVSLVVIHSCEGGYAGCWGWLRNSAAQASAHYVVKENGSEITQLVRESNKAWHVAANYACSRNGNQQCSKNGVNVNYFSVGIEHGGFASQASWQNGLIEASAKLTCSILRRAGQPRDRYHIVSHAQLQPWDRRDPGPNWPWSQYVSRVRAYCNDGAAGGGGGGGTGTTPIIVDSNNSHNDATKAKFELTGSWTASTGTPGYYGSGYYFAATSATSAPATFRFYMAAAGTRTIDAWWTSGSNRSTAAPFIAYNAAGGEVGRKTVNQQANGGKWVTLGTWSFQKGWNSISLSRWTSGDVVIADAIRAR